MGRLIRAEPLAMLAGAYLVLDDPLTRRRGGPATPAVAERLADPGPLPVAGAA